MSTEDYVVNLILVALVLRQLRGKRLTALQLLWPMALVAWAAVSYLHPVPPVGHDVALVVVCAVAGVGLGGAAGILTRVARGPDGVLVARATGAAALLWVVGVGSRMAFALLAEHGGGPAIARFSAEHQITSALVWADALVAMALSEVVARTVVLVARAWRTGRSGGGRVAGSSWAAARPTMTR